MWHAGNHVPIWTLARHACTPSLTFKHDVSSATSKRLRAVISLTMLRILSLYSGASAFSGSAEYARTPAARVSGPTATRLQRIVVTSTNYVGPNEMVHHRRSTRHARGIATHLGRRGAAAANRIDARRPHCMLIQTTVCVRRGCGSGGLTDGRNREANTLYHTHTHTYGTRATHV